MPSENSAFYRKVPLITNALNAAKKCPETIFLAIFADADEECERMPCAVTVENLRDIGPVPNAADVITENRERKEGKEGEGEEEEDEEIPAWIRYLPKGNLERQHTRASIGDLGSDSVEQVQRRVSQRPSSNPFGSTSLKATSVSRQQREKRMSANEPYRAGDRGDRARVRDILKEKLNMCNVSEASMLLSMSCIDKKEKQVSSVPQY